MLIPRGGAGLIRTVVMNATVPVIETGTGNCHVYVDATADLEMAKNILVNAKCQRPSVCNAAESLLVHKDARVVAPETSCNCCCCALHEVPRSICSCFGGDDLVLSNDGYQLFVTLGQFSIIRLERDIQLLMPAYDAVEADGQDIACERAVLAIGHSARDTFAALHRNGVYFEPKAFSVGVRIEHLQTEIDRALYGRLAGHPMLPPAEYNLSRRADGRACYSFCMCPGGVVVAAQSEEHTVVTNGMSYHARDGKNANAALAVSVDPKDYDDGTPFGGVALQRRIEHAAYAQTGSYRAPCQKVGDFLNGKPTRKLGAVKPSYPIGVELGEAAACLPDFAQTMLRDSLPYFGRKIRGYDTADALLTGPETRTSSPVRMTRGEDLFGLGCSGIIPCGEGAGYAGGIMSAAVDGIRAAFRIMGEFAN